MFLSIAKGAWLGFCIAAPVGPIGTLVLRQSLRSGLWAGLAGGLGAALADLCYGTLAAAGVRIAAAWSRPIAFAGGCILLWLAWRTWNESPAESTAQEQEDGSCRRIATTFLLTLSNPMTILSFAAMISAAGADEPAPFVAGVFLGSMAWWILLSSFSSLIAGWVELRNATLNRMAAITLAGFGVWGIVRRGLF